MPCENHYKSGLCRKRNKSPALPTFYTVTVCALDDEAERTESPINQEWLADFLSACLVVA